MAKEKEQTEKEHHYADRVWIWILLALILLVGVIAMIALVIPFLFSPNYPNGYTIMNISTKVSGISIVPNDNIPAYNRYLYVFEQPSVLGSPVPTQATLTLSNVKAGMQMLISNTTTLPLSVFAGSTPPGASTGTILTTQNSQGQPNWCIPSATAGSFITYQTSSTIPPGATFFFVAPSDNNLNLVQSTPINIIDSGYEVTSTVCS